MAGLFDSLSTATRSLDAARLGIDVAGQNLANVNTPGYTRRTLSLQEDAPTDLFSAGRGVTVAGITAMRDQFVTARLWHEQQGGAFEAAVYDGLVEVESAIGLPGESLDADLSALFDTFAMLAHDPTSTSARDAVVLQAEQLSRAFGTLSDRFDTTARNADTAMVSALEEVNQLAAEVADLNEAILANGTDVESLRDRRERAVSRLSELAGVSVIRGSDGTLNLSVGSGRPLVIGNTAYTLAAVAGGASGYASVVANGIDITGEISGGRVGGLIEVRDRLVPGYRAKLDQLAYDVASQVNAVHQSGFDLSGNAGVPFFAPLAGVAGAAASLAVNPSLVTDSTLVAASATGAPGDNQTARALAGLRDARIALGGTATAAVGWASLAYRVGTDVATRRDATALHDDVRSQLERLRAQSAGVSVDEEAANLMRFQRAYEANARYFTTIVDTLDTLMNMVQ